MRNPLLTALAVCAAVLGAAYCIGWYFQATQIKKGIEQAVARVNTGPQPYLTYDAIETSGFPGDITVSIVRPHFKGRIDEILKAQGSTALAPTANGVIQPQPANQLPAWDADVLLDGRLVIGINALSTRYSFRLSGNWQQTSTINGRTIAMQAQTAGDTTCEMTLARPGWLSPALWDFSALTRQDLLHDFRLLNCAGPGTVIIDPVSHIRIMSSGPGRIYISSTPQGDREQLRVYIKSSDSEITAQGDALMTDFLQAFSPGYPPTSHFSLYGKQNFELDLAYDGPQSLPRPLGTTPVDIALNRFSLNNDAYNFDGTLHFTNGPAASGRAASLSLRNEVSFGALYAGLMQDILHNAVMDFYRNPAAQPAQIQPYLQKYQPQAVIDILTPALPDLHALGKFTEAVEFKAQGDASLSTATIDLPVFELSATPYGFTGKGNATVTGRGLPTGTFALTCSNCLQLIDDAAAYDARLQQVVSYFNPDQAAAMALNPQLVTGIRQFLTALAVPGGEPPSPANFAFTLVSDAASGISINGKPAAQIMQLFAQYIAPALKKPAAAASPPAAGMPATPAAPAAPLPAPH